MTAPWVQPGPTLVPPSMLFWQDYDQGPRPLETSAHAIGAKQIVDGMNPMKTAYAEAYGGAGEHQSGVHGAPREFATLITSIRSAGWSGSGIIGWINRRGEIVIHDGIHRSAAAMALGLESIPVSIHGRDEDWIAFRLAVKALNDGKHHLYQPIFHPDFDCWPCWRKDTRARIDQIVEWLRSVDVRTVCDLGCHAGTISHGLGRADFDVIGIDQNPLAVRVADKARIMTGLGSNAGFKVGSLPAEADAVVCLSAINHALVTDMAKADTLLEDIGRCCHYLVTDCPTPGDPVGGKTDWSDPERMIAWLETSGWLLLDRKDRGAELQRTLLFFERS